MIQRERRFRDKQIKFKIIKEMQVFYWLHSSFIRKFNQMPLKKISPKAISPKWSTNTPSYSNAKPTFFHQLTFPAVTSSLCTLAGVGTRLYLIWHFFFFSPPPWSDIFVSENKPEIRLKKKTTNKLISNSIIEDWQRLPKQPIVVLDGKKTYRLMNSA